MTLGLWAYEMSESRLLWIGASGVTPNSRLPTSTTWETTPPRPCPGHPPLPSESSGTHSPCGEPRMAAHQPARSCPREGAESPPTEAGWAGRGQGGG